MKPAIATSPVTPNSSSVEEISQQSFRTYLRVLVVMVTMPLLFVAVHSLFLWNAGETQPWSKVLQKQIETDAIYATALNTNSIGYKLAMVEHYHPEILVMGSSRVTAVRSDAFSGSFVNGGSMNSLESGLYFLKHALTSHKPKFILWGIDSVWFNNPDDSYSQNGNEPGLTQFKLLEPFRWIADGKLTWKQYFGIATNFLHETPSGHWKAIGVNGLIHQKGYRKDGYFFYGGTLTGKYITPEKGFAESLSYLQMGHTPYQSGSHINEKNWETFEKMVQLIQKFNIPFVTYFTPHANRVASEIRKRKNEFAYIDELSEKLKHSGIEFYDLRDGASIGATDCEFVDGRHPGDVAQYRIFLSILKKNPESVLRSFLSTSLVETKIQEFEGRTLAEPGVAEIDFLELGCHKSHTKINNASL